MNLVDYGSHCFGVGVFSQFQPIDCECLSDTSLNTDCCNKLYEQSCADVDFGQQLPF